MSKDNEKIYINLEWADFTPDSPVRRRYVMNLNDYSVDLSEWGSGKEKIAYSNKYSKLFFYGSSYHNIRQIDPNFNSFDRILDDNKNITSIQDICFSNSNPYIYIVTKENLFIYDFEKEVMIDERLYQHRDLSSNGCREVGNDKYLVISGHEETSGNKTFLYHITSGLLVDSVPSKCYDYLAIENYDDNSVIFGDGNGKINIWKSELIDTVFSSKFVTTDTVASVNDTIGFYDISTGNPNRWMWDFGDGTTSIAQNPKHKYEKPGTYTVSLKVWDDEISSVEEKTDYIRITGNLEAAFSLDVTRGHYPLTVQFNNESTGYIESYKWEFGDKLSSSEENPLHTYKEAGFYEPKLIVYDGYFYDTAYAEIPINVFYEEVENIEFFLERRLDNANETSWCIEDDTLGYIYSYYKSWKEEIQHGGYYWIRNTKVNSVSSNGRELNLFYYESESNLFFDKIEKMNNSFLLHYAGDYYGYTFRDKNFNQISDVQFGYWDHNTYMNLYGVVSENEFAIINRNQKENPNETRLTIRNDKNNVVWDTTYSDLNELLFFKKLINSNYLFVQNDKFLFVDEKGNIISESNHSEGSLFNESRYTRHNERIIPCSDNGFLFWKGVFVKKNDIWVEVPTILSYDENGKLRNKVEWDSSFTKITYGTRVDDNKYVFTGQIDGCIALLFTDKLGRETSRLVFKGRGGYATGITKTKDGGYFLVGNSGGRVYVAKFALLSPSNLDEENGLSVQNLECSIYPNPAEDQIIVTLSDTYISAPEIDIIDYLGNVIRWTPSAELDSI
jgi:PKD repeat protein